VQEVTRAFLYSNQVYSGLTEASIHPQLIEIEGGRIRSTVSCSRSDLPTLLPHGAELTDVGNHLVTPAFVNGHTHLSMNVFRGIGLDAMAGNIVEDLYFHLEHDLSADDVRAFTRMGAYDCLLAGVGTVWDHYYHAEAVCLALMDVGLTGVVAPTLQDIHGPGVQWLDAQWDSIGTIHENTTYAEHGIYAAFGPHATDTVSDELWRRVALAASEFNIPIHAHVAQSVEEYDRSMELHGCSPIERLDRLDVLDAGSSALLVHGLFVSSADISRLRPQRNILGYCPFSQVQFCFPAAVSQWVEAGIPIMVGTDSGACNDTMNVQQELRLMGGGSGYSIMTSTAGTDFLSAGTLPRARALEENRATSLESRHGFSTPCRLLDTVWSTPSQAHAHMKAGVLVEGAMANIAIWDLSHPAVWPANDPLRTIAMCDTKGALYGLMTNGIWRGELGRFAASILESSEYRTAHAEADQRLSLLKERLRLT